MSYSSVQMLSAPADVMAAIVADCAARRPDEACGLLLGTAEGDRIRIIRAPPVENTWTETAERPSRYSIDPLTQARAESAALAEGLSLVGFYHSHPRDPAVPSDFDLGRAWPAYLYLIVGFDDPKYPTPRAWALDGGGVFREHSVELENL